MQYSVLRRPKRSPCPQPPTGSKRVGVSLDIERQANFRHLPGPTGTGTGGWLGWGSAGTVVASSSSTSTIPPVGPCRNDFDKGGGRLELPGPLFNGCRSFVCGTGGATDRHICEQTAHGI